MYLIIFLIFCQFILTMGKFPFQDPTLSWDKRVEDLISRMTLEEIINQTLIRDEETTPEIPHLNVKPYAWNTECSHGQFEVNSTSFPQSLGLAASFNEALIYKMAEAISIEQRAHWNINRKTGYKNNRMGLNCLSPNINIMRHPLWGRNQETYGEDPFLSGTLVRNYIKGLHGNHPRYMRAIGGCKHFDVHGGPENIPYDRMSFDSKVSMADWRMTYLPQFKICVEAGTYNLMCSYNSINGIPACVNKQLLTDILRKEWNFTGFVVSDSMALEFVISEHKYFPDKIKTAAASIKAGCNLELSGKVLMHQLEALKVGLLTENDIRENVKPIMYARMRFGEFDPEDMNPYNTIKESEVVQSAEHQLLSLQAAMQTFVLLKNKNDVLPMMNMCKRVALIGPFFNATEELFGNYHSKISEKFTKKLYLNLIMTGDSGVMVTGCSTTDCANYNQTEVKNAVIGSDRIIIALGNSLQVENEGIDRSNIQLPGKQLNILLDAIAHADPNSKIILLLFNAGPVDITYAKYSHRVDAILECFFPGQTAGDAVYHTLTASAGPVSIPAGRLPNTWPAFLKQVPPITNYDMKGHTYRYYEGVPLYPFGYGLSYTQFFYSNLNIHKQNVPQKSSLNFTINVANVGNFDAFEVIQVYVSWPPNLDSSIPIPKIQLVAFKKILIPIGKNVKLKFTISTERFNVWSQNAYTVIKGTMQLYVGGQQPLQFDKVSSNVISQSFNII